MTRLNKKIKSPSPMTIGGEKPLVWLDPGDFNYVVLNDLKVRALREKTTGFKDFENTVDTQQPTLIPDGFGVGKSAIRTLDSGRFDKLQTSIVAPSPSLIAGEFTLVFIIKLFALAQQAETTLFQSYHPGMPYMDVYVQNSTSKAQLSANGPVILSDNALSYGVPQLIVMRYSYSRALLDMRIGGVNQADTNTAVTPQFANRLTLGNNTSAARCGTVYYGRFLVYHKYLIDRQIAKLEQWYNNYYNL